MLSTSFFLSRKVPPGFCLSWAEILCRVLSGMLNCFLMESRGTMVFNSLVAALLTSFGLGFLECLLTGDIVKCKFTASVVDTGGNWQQQHTCHKCWWYWWCTLTREYIPEFLKKFELTLMLISRAWSKMIYEKNLKQTIWWHCPF